MLLIIWIIIHQYVYNWTGLPLILARFSVLLSTGLSFFYFLGSQFIKKNILCNFVDKKSLRTQLKKSIACRQMLTRAELHLFLNKRKWSIVFHELKILPKYSEICQKSLAQIEFILLCSSCTSCMCDLFHGVTMHLEF